MARRHLHELLKEEQEPFVLKNYINERRCRLRRPTSKARNHSLQLKAKRPISQNPPSFLSNFRKTQSCFFHSHDPAQPTKSPVFDFPKSPRRNSNTRLINVPSITAALLLESALRIQKQSSTSQKRKNRGFGFLRTMLKRVFMWRTQKRETFTENLPWVSFEDLQRLADRRITNDVGTDMGVEGNKIADLGFSCSLRRSNRMEDSEENRSLDIEACGTCGGSRELQETDGEERTIGDSRPCDRLSCSSSFRFQGLEWEPESGFRTPELGSPEISPALRQNEVFPCMSSGNNGSTSSQESDREFTEGEEKEQSSPVSVLEPPFQDDLQVHERGDYEADEEEDEEGSFENNLAAIQRAKQNLLNKIRRFERLAELDPLDLEELLGQEGNEEEEKEEEVRFGNKDYVKQFQVLFDCKRMGNLEFEIQQEGRIYQCLWRIPCDIMTECWNSKPNKIEDRVEVDFGRGEGEWRRNRNELEEIAKDVELAIFGVLISDLSLDLVQTTC